MQKRDRKLQKNKREGMWSLSPTRGAGGGTGDGGRKVVKEKMLSTFPN